MPSKMTSGILNYNWPRCRCFWILPASITPLWQPLSTNTLLWLLSWSQQNHQILEWLLKSWPSKTKGITWDVFGAETPFPLNWSRFFRQIHLCNRRMSTAKSSHYDGILQENLADQHSKQCVFNKILYQTQPKCTPERPSIERLGTMFGSFFVDKITEVCESFPDVPPSAIIPSLQISNETTQVYQFSSSLWGRNTVTNSSIS